MHSAVGWQIKTITMKSILVIIIFTVLFSFWGFGKETKTLFNDSVSVHETSLKISETQLDELYKLSSYGINLIKNKYLNYGTFSPIIFSYSNHKDFKVIKYDDPGLKDTLMADFAREILIRLTDQELKKDNIRIVCIVYKGKIKNAKYPNGNDCICLLFISKGFDNSVLDSFPVRIEDGKLMFEDVVVQIIKK
jgi:hypothetical protein